MLDSGYSDVAQIDEAMRLGAGHPMCQETRDPAFVVPGVLRRLVESGRLGRTTGRGFIVAA